MPIEPFNMQDFLLPGEPENNVDYQEGNSNVNEVNLSGNASVDDKDVFTYPAEMDITQNMGDVYDIINYHDQWISPKYKTLADYAKGRHHTILDKDAPMNNDKPDSRMIINFPKKLVDSFNGYDCGNPISITLASDNEKQNNNINPQISTWLNQNSYGDTFSELNRFACIYGRSYLYLYQDNGKYRITPCTPLDTLVVYDDTVAQHPDFAIRYEEDGNGSFDGTLITRDGEYSFEPSDAMMSQGQELKLKTAYGSQKLQNERDVDLPNLPVIEMVENNDRISTFGDVIGLIDSTNDILSQKNNDNHSLSNSYMVVSGTELTDEQKREMRKSHLINLVPPDDTNTVGNDNPPINVDFKSPSPSSQMQEETIDRNISLIYQMSGVVDFNDPQSGINTSNNSGTALKQLYQPMKAKAETKDSKFDKVMHELFMNIFSLWGLDVGLADSLQFHHQLAEPSNVTEETTAFKNLQGSQVPLATQLAYLSKIDDPQSTADQIKNNNSDQQQNVQKMINNAVNNNRRNGDSNDNNNNS